MARRKSPPETIRVRYYLSERLRAVRTELFGDRGGPELARRLGVPVRTWYNYESGVTVPSEIMLRFIELTTVEPVWLLHGLGPRFRIAPAQPALPGSIGSVESLLRTALEHLDEGTELDRRRTAEHFSPTPTALSLLDAGRPEERLAEANPSMPRAPWDDKVQGRKGYMRMKGDAMAPIIADGAFVAHSGDEEDASSLDGKLVVAWLQGGPTVRWFERSGDFALLRTENPEYVPAFTLIDLAALPADRPVRRILWVGTPH